MPITEDEFKSCMGAWPSGVAIVTTRTGAEVHGMTVSDFTGASLSPPLVVVLCHRDSITTGMIAEGKCFAVNILASGQDDLSNRFASKKLERVRFEGVSWDTAATGAPLISGALASLDCSLHATYDAGDHLIYVGLVEFLRQETSEPLVFWNSGYRALRNAGESAED